MSEKIQGAAEAIRLYKASVVSAKEAGVALRIVQRQLNFEGFTKWIRENLGHGEKVRQHVYYCIRVAHPTKKSEQGENREWLRISKGFKALRTATNIAAAEAAAERIRKAVDTKLAEVSAHLRKQQKAMAAVA